MSTTDVKAAQKDKVWLITGASTGFGRLMTEYLCGMGVTVVATARNIEHIQDFTTRFPGQAIVLSLDVTKPDSIAAAVKDALGHAGRVDVLMNNAGYGLAGAIEEVSEDEYMPMFETNVFGLLALTKALLPQFRARRSGAIINMSSVAGLVAGPGMGYYNATKFAVEGISTALHGEMKPLGVTVMTVEPGPFRTDFLGRSGVVAKEQIADYNETAGKMRTYFETQAGKQAGDPQRAVEAIAAAISSAEPPRHLLLGKNAITRYRVRLDEFRKELDDWEDVTLGADFPEGA